MIISCGVNGFPVDCFDILAHYGYKVYPYSKIKEQNPELYKMCFSYSEDAFHMGSRRLIAYNDKKPPRRIRFSLMHELGHLILEHKNDADENEREANYFAGNLLAPRIIMYYARLKKVQEISDLFDISSSAAYYSAQDFSLWCQEVCRQGMHDYDWALYRQFYNTAYGGLVYSVKRCEYCGALLYNAKESHCVTGCCIPDIPVASSFYTLTEEERAQVRALEYRWLYDF